MVGDTTTDMALAHRVGLRGILVETGWAGLDGQHPSMPDFITPDLGTAAELILRAWPAMREQAEALVPKIAPGSVVLVGGAARSGKSTFAGTLAIALREIGTPASVLSLDHWIRSESDREPGVLGRYDLAAATQAIVDLLQGQTVAIPRYAAQHRRSHANARAMQLAPGHALIVEGVPALISDTLRNIAAFTIHITVDEHTRMARFDATYRQRGLANVEIDALYDARNIDEVAAVVAASTSADRIIETR